MLALAALGLIASVRGPVGGTDAVRDLTGRATTLGLACFLVGLASLSLFAVKNWI